MTTIIDRQEMCSVCKAISTHKAIMSTNVSGWMDLDTRPPEMERSTLRYRVKECPECGYVANDLFRTLKTPHSFLLESEYLSFEDNRPKSELAVRFIKKARIAVKAGDTRQAMLDFLSAAWASDDSRDEYWQEHARLLALEQIEKISSNEMTINDVSIKADLLRRAGLFERVIEDYKDFDSKNDRLNKIIQFQLKKSLETDKSAYTVGDVI